MNKQNAVMRWGIWISLASLVAGGLCAQEAPPLPDAAPGELALLEMQLADARQENARLKGDLVRLKADTEALAQAARDPAANDEAQTLLAKLQQQLADRGAENDLLRGELKQMDADLADKRDANARLSAETEKIAATAEQRQKTVDNLLERLAAAEKQVVELQRKKGVPPEGADVPSVDKGAVEELEAQRRNLEDENAILKGQVEDLRTKLASADGALKDAKADFDKLFAGGGDHQKQTAALQRELEAIKATEAQRKEAMDGLFRQLAELKSRNAEAARQIEGLKGAIDQANRARDAVQANADGLENEKLLLSGQVADLSSMIADLETQRDELKGQLDMRAAEIRGEVAKQQDLQGQMERVAMTDKQRKQAMDELLGKLAVLEQSVARLERERAQARTDADEASRNLAALRDTLTQEKSSLADRIADLERRLAAAVDEAEATRATLTERTADADALRTQVAELEAVNAKLSRTEEQRKKTVDELLGKLADTERQMELVRNQLQSTEESLNAQLQEKSNQVAALSRDNVTLKEDVKRLERDWQAALTTRDELAAEAGRRDVEMQRQQAKLTEIEAETTRLRTIDTQRKIAMDKLLVEVSDTQARNSELESEVAATRRALEDAQRSPTRAVDPQALTALRDQVSILETENQALQQDVARLEGELTTARETPRDDAEKVWLDKIAVLEAQIKDLAAERDRVAAEAADARAKADELAALVAALQATAAGHEKALEQARAADGGEMDELKEMVAATAIERDRWRETAETAKADADRLTDEVARLTDAAKSGEDELATLGQQLSEAAAARDKLQATAQELQPRVDNLTREVTQLRGKLDGYNREMAKTREAWEQEKSGLKKALETAAAERDSTKTTLDAVIAEADGLRTENTRMRSEVASAEARKAEIQRDSDLFKEVERANVLLREKLLTTEAEREKLDKELAGLKRKADAFDAKLKTHETKRDELNEALEETRQREDEQRGLIEKLMVQVPDLERKVADLEAAKLAKDARLAEQDGIIDAMKVEIERREHRLAKAERVAEVLQSARDEVTQLNEKEQRDMHYNMAAVYAREGRFKDAEAEYLHALNLDATDADVHYNLAILYDDELKDTGKAAMHYQRYLKLRPHGDDADAVRQWLMKIEMKKRE